ncbi:hypothetical protein ACFE04_018357 [Oxalis oulophora]
MDTYESGFSSSSNQSDEENNNIDMRKGPWTAEEDSLLANYVALHGEGHWNSAARFAGLKRTGKSCRLRWLNYLRPDVRRGNITLEEQLLILDLHSRWGNRWSKIAEQLPGRTDNEIKNYWRTRVLKQAKQLKCDVNSQQFRDAMRYVWMPRLAERIQASSGQPITNDSGSSLGNYPNELPSVSSESVDINNNQVALASNSKCKPQQQEGGHYEYPDSTMQSGSVMMNPAEELGSCIDLQSYDQNAWLLGGSDLLDSMWNDENVCFLQQQLL